jgi:hypothetical protein
MARPYAELVAFCDSLDFNFDFTQFDSLEKEFWCFDVLTNQEKRQRTLATCNNTNWFGIYKGLWGAFKYEKLIHPIEFPEAEWEIYDRVQVIKRKLE